MDARLKADQTINVIVAIVDIRGLEMRKRRCNECGIRLKFFWNFCPNCGLLRDEPY